MKIFSDFHHGGLGRSLFLTLQHRLGHEVYFPSGDFAKWANETVVGTWLTPCLSNAGGIPEQYLDQYGELKNIVSKEEFLSQNWDAVIVSRPESQVLYKKLLQQHPQGLNIKRIGQSGNEGSYFDWDFVPNFMSSDYLSYIRRPHNINAIHYMQELGQQFQPDKFVPLREEDLCTVNTFINCLSTFTTWNWDRDQSWWGGHCPHCDGRNTPAPHVSVYGIWQEMKNQLPGHKFRDYGIINTMGMLPEKELPAAINTGALTWGYKTYEGYGHSIAQSIALGRLCIIPRRFLQYRTANQFMVPNLTCIETEWNVQSCVDAICWFTESLERANMYSEACFNAAKGIFNWEKEAFRVKEFLEDIR